MGGAGAVGHGLVMDGVVAVVGAASGIGEAVAESVCDAGAEVVVFDRDRAGAAAVARRIGADARYMDVTDSASVDEGLGAIERLVGMVNCAGTAGRIKPVVATSDEAWRR